ncbi:MAG: hypothetical protein HOP08_08805 [Cyclobacteriaceae bacterium]|nr:hypothetical protein [Cyclobacteriaceae bacterium]
MGNFRLIEFQKTRNFSDKVSITFVFFRQNFKGLSRSLLYIAGPPILVSSLLMGSSMKGIFSNSTAGPEAMANYFGSVNLWIEMLLSFVFFVVSIVSIIATINNYLILYQEKQTNEIEVSEVWQRVRKTFFMYLISSFLFGLFAMIAYFLLIIPTVVLAAISPLLIFLGILVLFGGFVYLFISASLLFVVQGFEKRNFFTAVERSFKLTRGKWWSTFGIYLILMLLVITIAYVFFIPGYLIMIMGSLHNTEGSSFNESGGILSFVVMMSMTLYFLSFMLLICLPMIGLSFQYFNLVELKEARGLLSQINTIGEVPIAPTEEEHY